MTTRSKQLVAMAKKKNTEDVLKQKTVQTIPTDFQTVIEKCQQYVNKLPKKKTIEQAARTSLSEKRKAEENDTGLIDRTLSKNMRQSDNIVIETNPPAIIPESKSKNSSEAISSPRRDDVGVAKEKVTFGDIGFMSFQQMNNINSPSIGHKSSVDEDDDTHPKSLSNESENLTIVKISPQKVQKVNKQRPITEH